MHLLVLSFVFRSLIFFCYRLYEVLLAAVAFYFSTVVASGERSVMTRVAAAAAMCAPERVGLGKL